MPNIYYNPDVAVTSSPSGFITGVARTFAEALTLMNTDAGGANLVSAGNGIYDIYVETTGGTFIQELFLADGYTCDATNTYRIIFRNDPDLREPTGFAAGTSGSFMQLRDDYVEAFGENGLQDFNIKPDLTNTDARALIYLARPNVKIHDFRSSALESGVANSSVSFCYEFYDSQMYNGIISGFGRPFYGAYRKASSGVISASTNLTVYKCSTYRSDSNGSLNNSAIFDTPVYSNGVAAASDYNALSESALTGSTGANNQFNLVATDCFVDPDNFDFTPKVGSPLIGAASDGGNIGAVQGAAPTALTITKPANLQAGVESANVVATNASADNLVQAAFSATLDSVDISSYITSFTNDGSNQYTLAFTLPVSFPRQFNATGYDLVVTENSIASTQTEVPYIEPTGKDYVNLTAGFIAVKLLETGETVAAGDERMVGNDIFSHAAGLGSSTTTPADGVDGWVFERPSSSVADGWTGTALTAGVQAVFDIAEGYTVNADGTWDFNRSATNNVVIDIYFIATDGTISPTSTYTYVLPVVTDITPDAFSFTDQVDVAISSTITSNQITVAGIAAATPISITTGGTYSIDGGAYVSSDGTITNGQTVTVRLTSSGSNSTSASVTLTMGGVSDTFTATTVAAVPVYPGIAFVADALVNNPSKASGAGLPRSNETVTVKVADSSDNKLLTTTVVLDASGALPSKINVPLATIGQSGFARFKFADSSGVVEFPVAFTEVGA
ncbi:MAG: hypothetical protein ACRBCS_03135 [Cellvibrionaceae bacterium]